VNTASHVKMPSMSTERTVQRRRPPTAFPRGIIDRLAITEIG